MPYCRNGESAALVLTDEKLGEVARLLESLKGIVGSDEGGEKCLLNGSLTCDPSAETVDGRVEIVKTNHYLVKRTGANHFLRHFAKLVLENDNVVAVPTDAASDVECQLVIEREQSGDLDEHVGTDGFVLCHFCNSRGAESCNSFLLWQRAEQLRRKKKETKEKIKTLINVNNTKMATETSAAIIFIVRS